MRSPLLLSPRQRIGQARSWLELLFDSLGVASFDQSHTDDQWLASLLQHAARLPSVVAPLPANADTRAVVLISQKATQLAAPFRPAVPSANREVHGQVVAWVGLGFCPALASATQWNGGWTPQGGRAGQDRARLVLEGFLARLQPLTRRFEGTFGQLLLSPVAALDPLLSARAAPLDQYALEIGYGRAVATRAQLIRLALTRTPSAATLALLHGAIGGPRPTSPEQMLVQGEARLAELARQLAGSGALCAAAYGLLAPPEVSIRGTWRHRPGGGCSPHTPATCPSFLRWTNRTTAPRRSLPSRRGALFAWCCASCSRRRRRVSRETWPSCRMAPALSFSPPVRAAHLTPRETATAPSWRPATPRRARACGLSSPDVPWKTRQASLSSGGWPSPLRPTAP